MSNVNIGIIGCGNISAAYLRTVQAFPILKCVAVADVDLARAQARAQEYGVPQASSVQELLADPSVEIVVNLTTPQSHAEIALAAINAGKHVYNEKPLTVTVAEGKLVVSHAKARGVRVGCAPGTFLGGGLQTCRKLIDAGAIGEPLVATAFMMGRGHESWHPDPEFYYKVGGGPMMDMGPYYLTALRSLLGGFRRVSGSSAIAIPQRVIGSEPKRGQTISVETPDHVAGTIDFASGVVGTIITSFAVMHAQYPPIQIFGSEGTLSVPDPNSLGGPVKIRASTDQDWRDVPLMFGHADGRMKWGIGVAEMAHAIRAERPHRATGEGALEVLETMHGFLDSAHDGQARNINGSPDRPLPLPPDLPEDALDD